MKAFLNKPERVSEYGLDMVVSEPFTLSYLPLIGLFVKAQTTITKIRTDWGEGERTI